MDLIQKIRFDLRALARVISIVENESQETEQIMNEVFPYTGNCYKIGLTGSPGVGKSSIIRHLVNEFRLQNKSVAVVAVDPSSSYTGGAFLGDRIRIQNQVIDDKVFIRSMASRGSYGGLARSIDDVINVLDAADWDIIIVEAVGAGQLEVDIRDLCDTVAVVLAPSMGDDIQAQKAGLMETADIFVVNKADQIGVDKTVYGINSMLEDISHENKWKPPVIKIIATEDRNESKIDSLMDAIDKHNKYITANGLFASCDINKLRNRIYKNIYQIITDKIDKEIENNENYGNIFTKVVQKEIDIYGAAKCLFEKLYKINYND